MSDPLVFMYEKKCQEQHKEIEAWKAGFIASRPMIAYLRYVAGEYIDGDDMQEDRYAEWGKMTQVERDMANRIVQVVFGDYL
jgi:hypothetical protein